MKKVRCPKCNSYTVFDETRYQPGQRLVFVCSECKKQFAIKIPAPLLLPRGGETKHETLPTEQVSPRGNCPLVAEQLGSVSDGGPKGLEGAAPRGDLEGVTPPWGSWRGAVIVVENAFHYRQEIPLEMGDNVFGRYVHGTNINKPIETVDPSVDTRHCIIRVQRGKDGQLQYILRDAPSGTGTFYMNEILRDQDRIRLQDGAVITIGATTLILKVNEE